jgi:ABC-type glycerol-3-phosphate transport system permease component
MAIGSDTVKSKQQETKGIYSAPSVGLWQRKSFQRNVRAAIAYFFLLIGSFCFVLPLLWMFSTSLKPDAEVFEFPPRFLPTSWDWNNYYLAWTALPFNTYLINTCIVTFSNVLGNLISCSLPAYGFARLRARGSNILFMLVLATMMVPFQVTLIPTFILFSKLGWVNTLLPITIPAWFGWPFSIFLLRQFFMGLPRELDDAARIDGCSYFRIYWNIILPLSKPALATIAIFGFIGNWNNFLGPLIYINKQELYTLALGLNLFRGQFVTYYNQLMAVSILALAPILIVFFFTQKQFIQGIALTGLKG